MFKKLNLLGVLAITFYSITTVYACNDKYLDQEAGAYVTKLWSSIPITQNTLIDSLGFLNDPKKVDSRYGQLNVFKELSRTSQDSLKDSSFPLFVEVCQRLFEESADLRVQVATHMLLERVYNRYSAELKKIERIKAREKAFVAQQEGKETKQPSAAFLEMFSHADKGVNTSLIHSH